MSGPTIRMPAEFLENETFIWKPIAGQRMKPKDVSPDVEERLSSHSLSLIHPRYADSDGFGGDCLKIFNTVANGRQFRLFGDELKDHPQISLIKSIEKNRIGYPSLLRVCTELLGMTKERLDSCLLHLLKTHVFYIVYHGSDDQTAFTAAVFLKRPQLVFLQRPPKKRVVEQNDDNKGKKQKEEASNNS